MKRAVQPSALLLKWGMTMNNKYKILLVEDEENIRTFVGAQLEADDYQVIHAESLRTGKMMYASHIPDLIVLDLGLPDGDGMGLLEYIRSVSSVPVIVLSARSGETDKVRALDAGANDYVTKPFGPAEFTARVRSALRNVRRIAGNSKFTLGGLVIDYDARAITLDGQEIKLTQTEYNIIALLSQNCGKVMTYSSIITAVWGYNDMGSIKKLQVNMANIRKKFGAVPGKDSYITNELGVGYKMNETIK